MPTPDDRLKESAPFAGNGSASENSPRSVDFIKINLIRGLVGVAVALLIWTSVLSGKRLGYDEPYHLGNCLLLAKEGLFSSTFLKGTGYSAAGPLYSVIYYVTSPLTGYKGPQIRIVNLVLLFFTCSMWALLFKRMDVQHSWLRSAIVLTIPPFWILAGLALTEIPTMLVTSAAVYLVWRALEQSKLKSTSAAFGIFALASACLSLACLGRATYLLVPILLIGCLILTRQGSILTVILLLCSLIPSAILFYIWGGLLPPGQTNVSHGISLNNALLGICYTAMAAALLSLDYSVLLDRRAGLLAGLVFIGNLAVGGFRRAPDLGFGLYGRTDTLGLIYSRLIGSFLIALAVFSSVLVLECLWKFWRQKDVFRLWLLSSIIAFSLTPLLITHLWSIRYALGSIPFLIPILGDRIQLSWFRVLVLGVAIFLGDEMLHHYLNGHFPDSDLAFPSNGGESPPHP